MEQVHSGICETGLFHHQFSWLLLKDMDEKLHPTENYEMWLLIHALLSYNLC